MGNARNDTDVKKLFDKLNSLTDLLSAVRGSSKADAKVLPIRHSKTSFAYPSQPAFRYPSVVNQSSVPFKKTYNFYDSAISHHKNSHRFPNPNVFNNSQQRGRYFASSSYTLSKPPANSRYSKTNINTQGSSSSSESAKVLLAKYSAKKAKDASDRRVLSNAHNTGSDTQKYGAVCVATEVAKRCVSEHIVVAESVKNCSQCSENIKVVETVEEQHNCAQLLVTDHYQLLHHSESSAEDSKLELAVLDVVNEILSKIEFSWDSVKDIENEFLEPDDQVPCNLDLHDPLEPNEIPLIDQTVEQATVSGSTLTNHLPNQIMDLAPSVLETCNLTNTDELTPKQRAAKAMVELLKSKRKMLNSNLSGEPTAMQKQHCAPKQIWKSKYKVVNKNLVHDSTKPVTHALVSNSSAKKISLAESVLGPETVKTNLGLKPSTVVVKNKYKLVNDTKKCVSVKKGTPSTKVMRSRRISLGMSKRPKSPLSKSGSDNQQTSNLLGSSAWMKDSCTKSPLKRTVLSSSQGATSTAPKARENWSEALTKKLNKMELETRSLYKGYDLSLISPMELVALDHTTLLKIAAAEKKPEAFVKKSKYKIVSGNKASVSKSEVNREKKRKSGMTPAKLQAFKKLGSAKKVKPLLIQKSRFCAATPSKYVKLSSRKLSGEFSKLYKRADFAGKTSPVVFKASTPQARNLASRVLNRSIKRASAASSKKTSPNSNAYCIFFNRFGKCNRAENCPYIHDPSKIAVCTRFLRGSCKVKGCPFSHEINPGKMAICSFFLQGACKKNELCPYRHETIKPGTELCKAFVRGYCPNGSQCTKAHILICPDYAQGGCEKGEDCCYPHPPRKAKRRIENEFSADLKKAKKEHVKEEVNDLKAEESKEDFRYFSHDPVTGEITYIEGEDSACLPNPMQMSSLPQYIPLHIKTQYIPERFDDAECLE